MAILSMQGLSKRFGGILAVNNVDLTVEVNEILGIIGPNGAGKSTLFNLISGFYRPTKGHVMLDNEDITNLKPNIIARKGIARTFQITNLFKNNSVLENLMIGFHSRYQTGFLKSVLRTPGHRNTRESFITEAHNILNELGVEKHANTLVKNLPHGTQRAVGLALAIVLKPKVLLLDEPFAGMIESEVQNLIDKVRKINQEQKVTIMLVEHNLRAVMKLCHRVAVINFGSKIAEGKPEEVNQDPEVIKAYLG